MTTLQQAFEQRDEAMQLVEQRAENEPSWDLSAVSLFVIDYLRANGPASSEDITDAAKKMGHVPHDDRAFGSVYYRLRRAGRITPVMANRHRRKGHATCGGYIWGLA